MISKLKSIVFALFALVIPMTVQAQVDRTPNLATTVPSGWSTDRYAPCSFALANGVNGRNNVLQETVCSAGAAANRPTAYSGSFYDTQGMVIAIDPVNVASPASQKVTFDLWIESAWATPNSQSGVVSTGMWTRVNQVASDAEANAWYPILNFSNASGTGVFRYWNSNLGYQTLGAAVNYNAWNTFEIDFTGNVFNAYVNGVLQATETADPGTTRLTSVLIETYNNGGAGYTTNWSNTPTSTVPEPSTYVLMASGLAALAFVSKRRKRSVQNPPAA